MSVLVHNNIACASPQFLYSITPKDQCCLIAALLAEEMDRMIPSHELPVFALVTIYFLLPVRLEKEEAYK